VVTTISQLLERIDGKRHPRHDGANCGWKRNSRLYALDAQVILCPTDVVVSLFRTPLSQLPETLFSNKVRMATGDFVASVPQLSSHGCRPYFAAKI
jgi:hypothetical protein